MGRNVKGTWVKVKYLVGKDKNMSLAEILEKIRKARYGREIREAIAQGIEMANDISNEALSQTKADAETLTNELFNCEQFKTQFNLDMVVGSAIATNVGFREALADNISTDTLFADALLGNQDLWNELGEGTYMVSAFARNNTFGRDFASNSAFVSGFANNSTFGSAFANNSTFVSVFAGNSEFANIFANNSVFASIFAKNNTFGNVFASNTAFIDGLFYALQAIKSAMLVPVPSAGDAGKVLVATGSSGASWIES